MKMRNLWALVMLSCTLASGTTAIASGLPESRIDNTLTPLPLHANRVARDGTLTQWDQLAPGNPYDDGGLTTPTNPAIATIGNSCDGRTALTPAQIDAVLAAHNTARDTENANLPAMRWNCDLAAVAQEWANRGDFNHSSSSWRQSQYQTESGQSVGWIGENLYWYSAPNGNPVAAVTSWEDERQYYNYSNNSCSGVCGHYTQIVWEETTDVGCGVYNQGETIVVCQYLPGGNVNNRRPY